MALSLAAFAWFAWQHIPGGSPAPAGQQRAAGDSVRGQVYFGPPNSIAVLPFSHAGQEPERAAQAEGFASEILEALVDVPGLRVTARSSSFFFRGHGGATRVIAERLQAAHLLAGEWRLEGERVVLALSLFDARADRETWRKDYPASLEELLGLRGVLCAEIVAQLPVAPYAGPCPVAAVEPRAWLLYAQGLYYADPSGEPDLLRAAEALHAALAAEPAYLAARLELAQLWLHPAWPAGAAGEEPVTLAREAVRQALDQDPDAARAWGLLSYIRHRYDWDWQGAVDAGRRAARMRPGDAGILGVASLALATVGEFGEAQELLGEAVRRDPLNLGRRIRLGLLQEFGGEYDGALATYRQVLALNPDYPGGHAFRARVKLLQGKADSAWRESEQETDPFWRRYAGILALLAQEQPETAHAQLKEMIDDSGPAAAFQVAEILAFGGEAEQSFEWLERAYEQRDPGLASIVGNRLFDKLHADQRWPGWLARLQLESPGPDGVSRPKSP